MLDALDGTAYITDRDGRLVCVGSSNWNGFANDNKGEELARTPPLGRPILDGIDGEEVRSFYKRAHEVAVSGGRRITFGFRCDAPDVERRMRLAIGPLRLDGKVVGVLYQSTILSERTRPPFRFLDAAAALDQYRENAGPLVASCSFCAKVHWPADSDGPWLEPDDYYRSGGLSAVRITHGVCPDCVHALPQLVA
jgi:hypothetical protein